MHPQVAVVYKGLVGLVEQGVEVPYTVEGHLVDDELGLVCPQPVQRRSHVGIDNERAVVELLHVAVEPLIHAVQILVLGRIEDYFNI